MKTPVIAIFDIGKTNKKLFLIDEQYRIVLEKNEQFDETTDVENGYDGRFHKYFFENQIFNLDLLLEI